MSAREEGASGMPQGNTRGDSPTCIIMGERGKEWRRVGGAVGRGEGRGEGE